MISRKKFLKTLIISGLASIGSQRLSVSLAQSKNQIQFYIAPNGNDSWSGKLPNSDRTNTDGPFATLQKARDAIRELKRQQGGTLKQPITVFLRDGTYFLTQPLDFTSEDAGTAEFPIVYTAYQNEKPIISGGKPIRDWKEEKINGNRVWVAELPEVKNGQWQFRNLWVNGERRYRARYPDQGYLVADKNPSGIDGWFSIAVKKEDFKPPLSEWTNFTDAIAIVGTSWAEQNMFVKSIDKQQRRINFAHGTSIETYPGCVFYLENSLNFLTRPGEWYLERNNGRLYYLPKPGEDIETVEVIAPVLTQLMLLKGTASNPSDRKVTYKFVEHLQFQGLTFSHSNWEIPPGNASFGQAAINTGVSQVWAPCSGVIQGEGIRHCSWENCAIEHIGSWAIDFGIGCTNNKVINCKLFDLGAGGVRVGVSDGRGYDYDDDRLTHSNEISNCHIYEIGRVYIGAAGIWVGQSHKNLLARNHIHDLHYVGISVGWTWGYGGKAKGNIVEFNHIHHIGRLTNGELPFLRDLGAIYLLGVQPGTVIRNNHIHDIDAYGGMGWGIYIDEGGSYILIENNLIYKTLSGGFHQHYGKENIIRNNIFAFGKQAQLQRYRPETHVSFTFERNIIYYSEGEMLTGYWEPINCEFDRNLYWRVDSGEFQFSNLSWEEWRNQGMDKHSVIADPLFVNPDEGNFNIKPNSPTVQIGFSPFLT